ncbi:MAG: hypothetical protein AAGG50_01130 [Bacteroidota bacterium]
MAVLHDRLLVAGAHLFYLEAGSRSASLYVVRAEAGCTTATRRVTVLR